MKSSTNVAEKKGLRTQVLLLARGGAYVDRLVAGLPEPSLGGGPHPMHLGFAQSPVCPTRCDRPAPHADSSEVG